MALEHFVTDFLM